MSYSVDNQNTYDSAGLKQEKARKWANLAGQEDCYTLSWL